MYTGMEVAVKQWGYESKPHWQHAVVDRVAVGGGQGQKHTLTMINNDGQRGETVQLVGRRIMQYWPDYEAEMGDHLGKVQEQEFKNKLLEQYRQMHVDETNDFVSMLALIGIPAHASVNYRFDPADDESYGADLHISRPDRLREILEPLIRERLYNPFRSSEADSETLDDN